MNTEQYKSLKVRKNGMSILEILIAIGVISFVCIPAIQIIYSLQSTYMSEIIENAPANAQYKATPSGNNILAVKYHGDGSLRTLLKKGGMREVHDANSFGVFNRNTCSDFYQNFDKNIAPLLHLYTYDDLGISSSTKLTGISFVGNSLLMSADSASTSMADVYSFDIDVSIYSSTTPFNSSKPELSLSLEQDTGPGASQIQSQGTYIFTSNTGVKNQANIFMVNLDSGNSVQSFSKISDLVIPGSNSSTTPITKAVLYANGKVFVGTEKSVFPEIFIFNAQTGQVEGSIEIGYGVNDMLIADNLLIVAGPRDPEIEVFDMSSLQKIGEYDLPGGSGNAKVLNIFGDDLYIGRTKGGDEFMILQMHRQDSNPTSPFIPMFTPIFDYKMRWSIDSILKSKQYSMIFTADEYFEFQIFQDTSMSSHKALLHKVDLPDRVSSSLCMKNSIWVTFKNLDNMSPYRLGILVFK